MASRGLTLAAGLALVALSPAAYAATGSPPVTHPDELTMFAGEAVTVDPVDNDSDPDGDALQVCRLGPDVPRTLSQSSVREGDLQVVTSRRARGTYTMTYYACDDSYLTAGTITVHVKPARPTLEVVTVGDAPPGRLRIKNTYKHRTFHCQWGPAGSDRVEGRATVRPRSAVTINVKEASVDVECRSGNQGYGFEIVGSQTSGRAQVSRSYSANASGGGQAQTRLRSP